MTAAKQLSAEEIAFLHSFCKKKDIVLVDLRIELVDHLAEQILAYQEKHPTTNFKDALFAVYKSYGIFGFMEIAAAHQKTMEKRYWAEIWRYFKTWLTPPKVLLTLAISAVLYIAFSQFTSTRMPVLFTIGIVFFSSIGITVYQYRRNKKVLNGEKNMLMSGAHNGVFWFGYLFVQVFLRLLAKEDGLLLEPAFLTAFFMITSIFSLANYFLQEKAFVQLQEMKQHLA